MPVRKLVSKIFFDPYHPHSLKRRLNTSVGSAPNKLQGYAAVLVFFARVLLGRNVEGNWALSQTEPPLSETYRNQTVRPNNERTELRRTSALN
jgi:hypothetical protein